MALGDETILGPYDNNAAGHVSAGAALNTAWASANDVVVTLMGAGNLQFSLIHIAGA